MGLARCLEPQKAVWGMVTPGVKSKKDKGKMELDHIALIVSKEENLAFYEKLGVIEKNRMERGYDTVVFMENNFIVQKIFIDLNHPQRVTNPEAMGLRHIAFAVDNLEEVMKVVECEEIGTDWFGRKFTFTKDLDGQPIEVIQRKPEIGAARYKPDELWVKEYKEQFSTEPSFM